jgi:hypothetical protein
MKTNELTGAGLDWAVARCENSDSGFFTDNKLVFINSPAFGVMRYQPTLLWAQGGPIIERELICLDCQFDANEWHAWTPAPEQVTGEAIAVGDTPLIAAMRCYVASKLGADVEIPQELTK